METNKIIIPDGCKAEIRTENGRTVVIIERKRHIGNLGGRSWNAQFYEEYSTFQLDSFLNKGTPLEDKLFSNGNYFHSADACQAFCDGLNKAIKPIFEKAKRGEYDG